MFRDLIGCLIGFPYFITKFFPLDSFVLTSVLYEYQLSDDYQCVNISLLMGKYVSNY